MPDAQNEKKEGVRSPSFFQGLADFKSTRHYRRMNVAAEEVIARGRGRRERVCNRTGAGHVLPLENRRSGTGIGVNREVMLDARIHVVEIDGHFRSGRNADVTQVERHAGSRQRDSGWRGCGSRGWKCRNGPRCGCRTRRSR